MTNETFAEITKLKNRITELEDEVTFKSELLREYTYAIKLLNDRFSSVNRNRETQMNKYGI